MCDKQYRNNKGRFAKKKNVDKVKKCLKAMTAAKVKDESSCSSADSCISNLEGKRIIDIKVFSKNLKCKSCSNLLDLEKSSKERVVAQASIFTIICEKCKIVNDVCTSNVHEINNKVLYENNTCLILGELFYLNIYYNFICFNLSFFNYS